MQLKEYIDDTEDFINIELVSVSHQICLCPGQFRNFFLEWSLRISSNLSSFSNLPLKVLCNDGYLG